MSTFCEIFLDEQDEGQRNEGQRKGLSRHDFYDAVALCSRRLPNRDDLNAIYDSLSRSYIVESAYLASPAWMRSSPIADYKKEAISSHKYNDVSFIIVSLGYDAPLGYLTPQDCPHEILVLFADGSCKLLREQIRK